ncbi:MAG: replication initiator protein A [Deltaproteobacteria bacterium]|nr:replication initiator protein A [Deltaproteobacteria bacterium]
MDQLILTQMPKRLSRDEMNLAEFPLTVLSTRSNPKTKTLEFSDNIRTKNGELVDRKWIITGADKFGLPTASDDEVLLGLLKLTVESGMRNPKVYFTRYEILKTLRWTTEGRSYTRLQRALDRLSGVRIKATNAFYDNETKLHHTKNFGIIDGYEINDGRDGENKRSFFIWSEVLFKSFQVGFIKKLDLEFYLSLKSAISKRVYRFLDKHFWYKAKVQMNLFCFAHEKVGISRNYKYTSSIRQQLDPAFEELIHTGFLSKVEYYGKGSDCEIVMYAARGKPRSLDKPTEEESGRPVQPMLLPPSEPVGDEDRELAGLLINRGISAPQARRLVSGRSLELRGKIRRVIEHVDKLIAGNSKLVQRSPVGFLYRAVENVESFMLPGEDMGGYSRGDGASSTQHIKEPRAQKSSGKASSKTDFTLESRYLVERKQAISELKLSVEEQMLQNITREVREALSRLKGLISETRFEEAVNHGVDEKLAKLFALPDFSEWCKRNGHKFNC